MWAVFQGAAQKTHDGCIRPRCMHGHPCCFYLNTHEQPLPSLAAGLYLCVSSYRAGFKGVRAGAWPCGCMGDLAEIQVTDQARPGQAVTRPSPPLRPTDHPRMAKLSLTYPVAAAARAPWASGGGFWCRSQPTSAICLIHCLLHPKPGTTRFLYYS